MRCLRDLTFSLCAFPAAAHPNCIHLALVEIATPDQNSSLKREANTQRHEKAAAIWRRHHTQLSLHQDIRSIVCVCIDFRFGAERTKTV